jgi:hypothetical protein
MKKLASLTLSLFLTTGMAFADSPKDSPKDAPKDAAPAKAAATTTSTKTNAEIAAEMEELRQALQAQQEQLQMLKEELAKRDREIEAAREAAASANSRAAEATTKATEAVATSAEAKSTTDSLNSTVATMAASKPAPVNSMAGSSSDDEKGPATIRFKGVNLTPGGFIEAATVNRQRGLASDINTPFNSTPYGNNATGKLSEMNFTGRQSRLSLLVDTKLASTKVSGYYEADFLGAAVTSNDRQSNSYVLRQRQIWGRIELESGWAFSGGQMWSLVTENKASIANRTEILPLVVDPQYVVGFNWTRQPGFRVTKSFGDKFTVGASAEESQATLGGRGFSTYTSTTGTATTNSFTFAPGANGGLYNGTDSTGYSPNKLPDFIVKAAWDPGWGHYEVFGIISDFRNRIYPCAVVSIQNPVTSTATYTAPDGTIYTGTYTSQALSGAGAIVNPNCTNTTPSAALAENSSSTGGGGGFHLRAPVLHKKVDLGLSGLYGDGIGRYASAQLPDATLRPDGSLTLIHDGSWLGLIEWHATPKFDIYAYVGGEYAARAAYTGYESVTGTATTTNVTLTGTPVTPTSPGFIILPETVTTWKTSISGAGGYGGPTANNSGCSTELPPGGNSAPSAGANCAGDTRYISEATLGFWHKIYQGEKGRLQWGAQYSYFYRNSWSGVNGTVSGQPHAVNNMVWTSFRYYIP